MNKAGKNTVVHYSQGVLSPETYLRSVPIDDEYLRPSGNQPGNGLTGEYFDNPNLEGSPVLCKGRFYDTNVLET